jgi:hypothetical protein
VQHDDRPPTAGLEVPDGSIWEVRNFGQHPAILVRSPVMIRRVLLAICVVSLATACTLKDDSSSAPPDVAAPPADALKTASGLASKVLIVGLGNVHPGPTSTVTVNYWGWTPDGQLFDSAAREGGPQTFPLNQVIPGWTEGLQLMVKGEKRRFWIPSKLAYGDNPSPGNPAGMLVFDIELLEVR